MQPIMTVAPGQVAGLEEIEEFGKRKARGRDIFSTQDLPDETVGRSKSMHVAETAHGALERVADDAEQKITGQVMLKCASIKRRLVIDVTPVFVRPSVVVLRRRGVAELVEEPDDDVGARRFRGKQDNHPL